MKLPMKKNVSAWLLMVSALALHVLDEAIFGFLDFYNPMVLSMRQLTGFFPMPIFPFNIWLGGLIIAVVIFFMLTFIVKRGGTIIRIFTTLLGIIMLANGLGHMIGSIFYGDLIPGFWSSPLLLITAVYVVIRGFKGQWQST